MITLSKKIPISYKSPMMWGWISKAIPMGWVVVLYNSIVSVDDDVVRKGSGSRDYWVEFYVDPPERITYCRNTEGGIVVRT